MNSKSMKENQIIYISSPSFELKISEVEEFGIQKLEEELIRKAGIKLKIPQEDRYSRYIIKIRGIETLRNKAGNYPLSFVVFKKSPISRVEEFERCVGILTIRRNISTEVYFLFFSFGILLGVVIIFLLKNS